MRLNVVAACLLSIVVSVSAWGADAPKPAAEQESAEKSISFINQVAPLMNRLGCNATQCHGSAKGKNGFQLSMFGADLKHDYTALTRSSAGRRVDVVQPPKSLFLLKATESIAHKGGQKLKVDSPEYKMLVSWIAQGAELGDAAARQLASINVVPEDLTLKKGESKQLSATAVFADGAEEDVTSDALFKSSDDKVAAVDESGKVQVNGFGQCAIVVNYMRRAGVARVVVAQPLPEAFPEVKTNNKIDELVFAKLKQLGIPPSDLCSDHEFLRRAYLDVIGTLPTADEARKFLADQDPEKRSKLIDTLLASDEFADYWALKWGDLLRVKSEFPSNLWPNAVQAYHRWIRHSIAQNKPYDQFARELLLSTGSNFRSPEANYYRAVPKKDAQNLAEVTALVFMGARIGCARCHAHPQESWTLDDSAGLAAFFAKMRFKTTQEWKEEIVYSSPKQSLRHPQTNEIVKPKFLGGEEAAVAWDEDPRPKFVEWLTAPDNPWFAKNIVNRTWFWLLGRGIVHEVDDLRFTNPPANPELLQYLQDELVGHKFDLKHVYRLILKSRTYQLSSKSNPLNENDVAHFSHYYVKRLGAATLLDAIGQVTDTSETYQSRIPEPFVRLPKGFRATHLSDGSIGVPFLALFGRPPRDTAFESDRDLEISMRQVLHLINSTHVQGRINISPRLKRLMKKHTDDAELVGEIYLSALSRSPTDEEKKNVVEYLAQNKNARTQAVQDVVWAIMNTKEFLFNH